MRSVGILTVGLGLALSTVLSGLGQGDKHIATGRQMYQSYCATCHGPEGAGDGVLAKSLRKRPANLTKLTKEPDGKFEPAQVFKAIEGTGRPASSDMPAWSDTFAKMRDTTGPDDVKAKISALVDYLESIQQAQR
jgi:mono/diheme cytochrome c family protein